MTSEVWTTDTVRYDEHHSFMATQRPSGSSKKRKPEKKPPPSRLNVLRQGEVWGSILILTGVLTLLAILSPRQGALTAWWTGALGSIVGNGLLLLIFLMIGFGLWGVLRSMGRLAHIPWYRPVGALMLFLAVITALHMDEALSDRQALALAQEGGGGGMVGYGLSGLLINTLGYDLAWILIVLTGIAGALLLLGPLLVATGSMVTDLVLNRQGNRLADPSGDALGAPRPAAAERAALLVADLLEPPAGSDAWPDVRR